MVRVNRRDVLAEGEVQVVHCLNRCVRRGFLCGDDPLTGKNYDHRRQWIRNRLEFLAGVFGVAPRHSAKTIVPFVEVTHHKTSPLCDTRVSTSFVN